MSQFLRQNVRAARTILTPTFWCLTAAICLNDKLIEIVSVNGPSMLPTLSPTYHETGGKDYLLLSKWAPTRKLKRGDIVSFYTPHKPDMLGIKRVVALEGDLVEVDGRRMAKDEVAGGRSVYHENMRMKIMVPVPKGHVWVEGDNWRKSKDSNDYGAISKGLINGKAVCVLWPLGRFWQKPWNGFEGIARVRPGQGAVLMALDDS